MPHKILWGPIVGLLACMILMIVLLDHMDAQLCDAVATGDAPTNTYTEEICND